MRAAWIAFALVVVVARAAGLLVVGVVATGSMGDALPAGSVFLAVAGSADVGDVVVFRTPDGMSVVHRVMEVTADGLVTQGDANPATDQAAGLPHVHPGEVAVVPEIAGTPVALKGNWIRPVALATMQISLLAFGVRRVIAEGADAGGIASRLRPHHLVLAGALILLLASPIMHEEVHASGVVTVSGTLLPTVARFETNEEVVHRNIPPLGEVTVGLRGPVDIVRAPALPGAMFLAERGATWAMLPSVLALASMALAFRIGGW